MLKELKDDKHKIQDFLYFGEAANNMGYTGRQNNIHNVLVKSGFLGIHYMLHIFHVSWMNVALH